MYIFGIHIIVCLWSEHPTLFYSTGLLFVQITHYHDVIDSRSKCLPGITYIHFREIAQVPRMLDRCTRENANITNATFKENDKKKTVVKTAKLRH